MSRPQPADTEYRIAHLKERLAAGETAELGVRAELRGGAVVLSGTVPTAGCRDEILRLAREELPGVPVRSDLVLAAADAPQQPEELA
ncbi:BON domain-containing protein [Streptomyces capparidis]